MVADTPTKAQSRERNLWQESSHLAGNPGPLPKSRVAHQKAGGHDGPKRQLWHPIGPGSFDLSGYVVNELIYDESTYLKWPGLLIVEAPLSCTIKVTHGSFPTVPEGCPLWPLASGLVF